MLKPAKVLLIYVPYMAMIAAISYVFGKNAEFEELLWDNGFLSLHHSHLINSVHMNTYQKNLHVLN